MLEENERRIMELKYAIEEGERSGIAEDFNPKKHLQSLKSRRGNG